jgi:prophage regulatory protein
MGHGHIPKGCIELNSAYAKLRQRDRGDFWIYDDQERPRINPRFLEGRPDDCDPQMWAAFRHAEETGEGPLIRAIKDGSLSIYDTDGRRILPRSFRMLPDLDWHATLVTGRLISIGPHDDDRTCLHVSESEFSEWFARLVAVDLLDLLRGAVADNGGPISQREAEKIARAASANEPRAKIRSLLEEVQGKQTRKTSNPVSGDTSQATSSTLPDAKSLRLLKEAQVRDLTTLSRITRWRMIRNGTFPKPIKISTGRVAWRESEVLAWLTSKT